MTTYAVIYPDSKQAVAVRRTRTAALAVIGHRPAGAQLVILEVSAIRGKPLAGGFPGMVPM